MSKQLTPEQLASLHVWSRNNAVNGGCAPSLILYALLLLFLMTGCKSVEYVEVVKHRTDSVYITQQLRDSIYLHDSVHVVERGDTVMIERWHTAWRERLRIDTLMQVRVDSIPVPYEVVKTKEVEKQLTWWEKTRIYLSNILLAGGALALIVWHGKKKLNL